MKNRMIFLTIMLLVSITKGLSQSGLKPTKDTSYAIISIISPASVFGEYQIKIYFGNDKVEDFKKVEYTRRDRDKLNNEIVNAINYLATKGYQLQTFGLYSSPGNDVQYIFKKVTTL